MSAYRPRGAAGRTPEGLVLSSVLALCQHHPKVGWAARMNVGAMKLDNRFVRFGMKGCADVIGQLKDGRFLAIECKAAKGQPTEHQVAFLERVKRSNGVAGIARSIDDARAILEAA